MEHFQPHQVLGDTHHRQLVPTLPPCTSHMMASCLFLQLLGTGRVLKGMELVGLKDPSMFEKVGPFWPAPERQSNPSVSPSLAICGHPEFSSEAQGM